MQDTDQKDVQKNADELIKKFYSKSNELNYSNLNENKKYAGWVSDFHLKYRKKNKKNFLVLKKKNDLFLLFILAIAWSRSSIWENAPYLISYIKFYKKDKIKYWINKTNIKNEIENKKRNSKEITKLVYGTKEPRKEISFREDIFCSINVLAKNWFEIIKRLKECSKESDYIKFMQYLHKINGLGCDNKGIFIKIPLILRELRCQNIFSIPGNICCVVDDRVKASCKEIGINIPTRYNSINYLVKSSKKIYRYFGDLYDIPLFAYNDIYNNQNNMASS